MVKLTGLSDGIESGGADRARGVEYSQILSECLLMSLAQCRKLSTILLGSQLEKSVGLLWMLRGGSLIDVQDQNMSSVFSGGDPSVRSLVTKAARVKWCRLLNSSQV